MKRYIPGILALCAVITSVLAAAQEQSDTPPEWERRYTCERRRGAIVIDGIPDEFDWVRARDFDAFVRYQPADTMTVEHQTTVRMVWDDRNLYLLIVADDTDVWSTIATPDSVCLCEEETVELFVDPDGDSLDYAEIHINPLGTVNDILIPSPTFPSGGVSDSMYAWSARNMQVAVDVRGTLNDPEDRDFGVVYELAVPWNAWGPVAENVELPPNPGDTWRMNVNRYERPRMGENGPVLSGWAPNDRVSFHVPGRFGYVTFVDNR